MRKDVLLVVSVFGFTSVLVEPITRAEESYVSVADVRNAADGFAAFVNDRKPLSEIANQSVWSIVETQMSTCQAGDLEPRRSLAWRDTVTVPDALLLGAFGAVAGGVCAYFIDHGVAAGAGLGAAGTVIGWRAAGLALQYMTLGFFDRISSDVAIPLPHMKARELAYETEEALIPAPQAARLFMSFLRTRHRIETPKGLSPKIWLALLSAGFSNTALNDPEAVKQIGLDLFTKLKQVTSSVPADERAKLEATLGALALGKTSLGQAFPAILRCQQLLDGSAT